jgi:hypothetical protein
MHYQSCHTICVNARDKALAFVSAGGKLCRGHGGRRRVPADHRVLRRHRILAGFHRIIAAKSLGLTEIDTDVRAGTRRDAILYAVGANAAHGLKRTNRDKRNAAMTLLRDPEWSAWSDNRIAAKCAVTQPFVSKLRSSLITVISEPASERTYTNKHGTTSTMTVTNIGARPGPAPAPAAEEWRQADIEDIAPQPTPAWPPEHTAPAGQIRYVLSMLDGRLTLTPGQAARAFTGTIREDTEIVDRVLSWLAKFQGELNAELSRREGSAAAD